MAESKFFGRSRARRIGLAVAGIGLGALIVGVSSVPAQAYITEDLMIYLDASKSASYGGSGITWTDISGSGRNGTLIGSVTYDGPSQSLRFPGGSNGSAYVDLDGDFGDFSGGLTIEFEGEFGTTRSAWERIFDFALGTDSVGSNINNVLWVGQFSNSNELTIETWISGVNQGRCHTSVTGGALGTPGDRSMHKWVLTLDGSLCRIYKDGIELPTMVRNANDSADTPEQANGSAYPLPAVTSRPSAFLGRSNFLADNDLEGSIRYIRIYNAALTPEEVVDNATNSNPSNPPDATPTMPDTGMSLRVTLFVTIGAMFLFAFAYLFFASRTRLRLAGTNARVKELLGSMTERLDRMEERNRAAAYRNAVRKRRSKLD